MSTNLDRGAHKEKGHTAVSLPRALAAEVTAAADLSGRSAARQLEHAFRIAQAIEQLLPTATVHALKSGALPASQLLAGLAAVMKAPAESAALHRVIEANPSRIHFDPTDPSKATLTQPDGTRVEGRLLENGEFVPGLVSQPVSSERSHDAAQKRPLKSTPKPSGRSTRKVLEHA